MLNKYCFLIFSVLIAIISIVYFNFLYFIKVPKSHNNNIFTFQELATYNGVEKKHLYLAILGNVFDVSKGRKHYDKGNDYNYFIGKDGSRSFVSGDFKDESENKDNVIDLDCKDLETLTNWVKTYKTTYIFKGTLIGRYYDENGEETLYKKELTEKVDNCKLQKQNDEALKLKYPPCNIEWSAKTGSRVWCSKNSGGVSRDWIGVPRKQFTPGQSITKCICLNPSEDHSLALLEEYERCPSAATSCKIESA